MYTLIVQLTSNYKLKLIIKINSHEDNVWFINTK